MAPRLTKTTSKTCLPASSSSSLSSKISVTWVRALNRWRVTQTKPNGPKTSTWFSRFSLRLLWIPINSRYLSKCKYYKSSRASNSNIWINPFKTSSSSNPDLKTRIIITCENENHYKLNIITFRILSNAFTKLIKYNCFISIINMSIKEIVGKRSTLMMYRDCLKVAPMMSPSNQAAIKNIKLHFRLEFEK